MQYRTENQLRARDTRRHISLIANAGSGKTAVLVDRYIDIIQQGHAGVRNVVALTFTEKAAGELRSRIVSEVETRRRETSDPDQRARLEMLREQLSSAIIDTIHSFCARLLRDDPVDVPTEEGGGIDASFTILEGVDQQSLLRDAVTEVFQKLLQPASGAPAASVIETVRMLGRSNVLRIIHHMLAKREILDGLLAGYKKSDEEILAGWNASVGNYLNGIFDSPSVDAAFRTLAAGVRAKHKSKIDSDLGKYFAAGDAGMRLQAFETLVLDLLTKRDLSLRKGIFDTEDAAGNYDAQLQTIRAAALTVLPFAEAMARGAEAHAALLKNTRALLDIVRDILAVYGRRKAENAQLDFEDLQLYVKALLTRPEIRERLSATYSYIMVDEFQDTNRLQYELLISLTENFLRGNLFIVGDPKQSIYGFRNADVGIFLRAIGEMSGAAVPGGTGEATLQPPVDRGMAVTLAESFRLLPAIAAFVDTVFGSCMDPAQNRFSVPYERLVVGRMTAADGKVEMLLPSNPAAAGHDSGSLLFGIEEEMIARRILVLVDEQSPVHEPRTDETRPIRFGDIAILLRSRTNLSRLEQALLHFHVPYLIFSGGGFFQTQELYDFFNYFQFLLNPHDDSALAGILRSPFFTCSDAALYRISRIPEGNDFWTKTTLWVSRYPGADPHVERAVRILQAGLLHAGRKSLSNLITEIIEQTGYSGIAAASRRAAQHTANVRKLLQLAGSFEARGFSNLFDFVERLRILIESEAEEGQASIDEAENAVHVMTIHAAKGLEFNAVIVPYLQKEIQYDKEPFIDDHASFAFGCADSADFESALPVPLTIMCSQESRRKTEAEEQRIFYVACTRARDVLILSALPSARARTQTMYSWLEQALAQSGTMAEDRWTGSVPLDRLTLIDGSITKVTGSFSLEIPVFRSPDQFPDVPLPMPEGRYEEKILHAEIGPIASSEKGAFFSASQIRTFHDCPLRYHLAYHLGMPGTTAEFSGDDETDEEEEREPLSATVFGTLVHRVLQNILTPAGDAEIPARVAEALAEEGVAVRKDAEVLSGRVESAVRAFCSSSFGRRVLAAEKTLTEYTLEGRFDDDYIGGTIDRLCLTAGRWEVIDYKTDSLRGTTSEKKNEAYRYQMMVYAWLVSRMMQQPEVPVTIFYTDRPEESSTRIISGRDIRDFEDEMRSIIAALRGSEFPKNLAHCHACPYAHNGRCIQN